MKQKAKKRKQIFDEEAVRAFAIQLKTLREKKGMSQQMLSDAAEIALSQIGRIETAQINPTISTLVRLAEALEIELNELFDFKVIRRKNNR